MYDMLSPDIPNSAAWREVARGTARSAKMVAASRDMERERYWLVGFCLVGPRTALEVSPAAFVVPHIVALNTQTASHIPAAGV
jgi:hypothetical protein